MSADQNNVTQLHRARPLPAPSVLPFHFITKSEASRALSMSESKIDELLNPKSPRYDKTFPKPRKVGARSIAFRSDELLEWMEARPVAGDVGADE